MSEALVCSRQCLRVAFGRADTVSLIGGQLDPPVRAKSFTGRLGRQIVQEAMKICYTTGIR